MSGLRVAATQYLAMRRALGFKLTTQGAHLMSFIDFCEAQGAEHIRADLALQWAIQTPKASNDGVYQARRLDVVRIFARHMQPLDPATEIPPDDVLVHRYRRIPPYQYSAEEIVALMDAADQLSPVVRAQTWRTLIGLLAVTGMRQGEACRLQRTHVDLDQGRITIVDSKFGKSRQVYLHPSAVTALSDYVRARDQAFGTPQAATFFLNSWGKSLDPGNIQRTFAALVNTAGIQTPGHRRSPRLHDLRHAFTIATMLDWYRDGHDVQARLPLLSTWLGHVDPKSTYWYLQAVPELLALAAGRLEQELPDQQVIS